MTKVIGPPEPAKALARALATADSEESATWELWLPFALAIFESFPDEWIIIPRREYMSLVADSAQADRDRAKIVDTVVRMVRTLLVDFLDPSSRSIALGNLAAEVRRLDQYDFRHDERDGRRPV